MTILLVVIYITFISLGLPDSLFGVAWPIAHIDFNVDESFGSVYSVVVAMTSGGISFFAGTLVRKFGTGKVTAISVLLTAVGMLGISFSPNVYIMMLFSIICGFGAGAIDTGLNAFVSVNYKAIHMNWLHCFWGVGVTVSPLIMSYFLKNADWRNGYRAVSYIQFGITLVVFLSLFLWKKYDVKRNNSELIKEEKKPKLKLSDVLKTKGIFCGITSLGVYCAMEQIISVWGASYLVNHVALTPATAAQYVSGYFGGIIVGRFISGILSLKVSDNNMIRGGTAISVIGMVTMIIPSSVAVLLGLIIIGIGFGPVFPSVIHLVSERFGQDKTVDISGFHMGGAYVIGYVLQLIFGFSATMTTFEIVPYCLMGFAIVTIIFNELTNIKVKI